MFWSHCRRLANTPPGAKATADIAITPNGEKPPWMGTDVPARNDSGIIIAKPMPCMASALRTSRPISSRQSER